MNLQEFCGEFASFLAKKPELDLLLARGQELVGELSGDPAWVYEYLRALISDPEFLNRQEPPIYQNQVALFRNADPPFSVRAYIWEPGASSPVHDHSAWGIIGVLAHPARETKYRRLDDGTRDGYAALEEVSSRVIPPGATTCIFPLDGGIHRMGPETDRATLTVNVYGPSVRSGYIPFFEPEKKSVSRAYSPKVVKKVLALRALGFLPEPSGRQILDGSVPHAIPDFLKKACADALSRAQET